MTEEKTRKIAKFASAEEIQQWSSNVGKFSVEVYKAIAPMMKTACNRCPIRNLISAGGCLTDSCPIHQIQYAVQRAAPRAANAIKEIYKEKYKA